MTLTKKQKGIIPFYVDKWFNMPLQPTDRVKSEYWVKKMYQELGKKEPIVIFVQSPMAAVILIKGNTELSIKEIRELFYSSLQWFDEAARYDFVKNECAVKYNKENFELFMGFIQYVHACFPFEDRVYVVDNPVAFHWNENKQLHCLTGPAVEYADGEGFYCIDGEVISKSKFNKVKKEDNVNA